MDAFEKWADDCDETDEKYYAIPVGSVARGVAREAFRAGMRAAAEINERARLKIETNLSRGKGTWPQADYIRDETWHNWLGHEQALRWARADILAEADK